MNRPSPTHLVLIPTYNTGPFVMDVVKNALEVWQPVWVVVDGSEDGTGEALEKLAESEPDLTVLRLPSNRGKGAAVLAGVQTAVNKGFTHVLTMDADGQHPVDAVGTFMLASAENTSAMILGNPKFDESAPALRVNGRKISNFWADLETLWAGIHDSLFGFRVYPIQPLIAVMKSTRFARRFDFDPEVVVRLAWRGVPPVNVSVPVRYLSAEEGGVSQFRYGRDNILLTWMHCRLIIGFIVRLPVILCRRFRQFEGSRPTLP